MSDQEQTETKSGGGFAGAVLGGAAGAVTARVAHNKVTNGLVKDALDGSLVNDKTGKALEQAEATTTAAKAGLNGNLATKIKSAHIDALKKPENIADISSVKFTQAEGAKTYVAEFANDAGKKVSLDGIAKLPKDVKLENGAATLVGEEAKKLTTGAEKSWVAKTVAAAEKGVVKEVRGSAAFKAAGGTLKQTGMKGKLAIIGLPVVAAVAVGGVAKAVFAGKHTSQVADQRNQPEPEVATAGAGR